LNRRIEQDPDLRRELLISLPEEVSKRDSWKYVKGEGLISMINFCSTQFSARFQKGLLIFSVEAFYLFDLEAMGPLKKVAPPFEVLFANPSVLGLDLFGSSQIDQDHENKERMKFFINGLIIPLHPNDLSCLWGDQISEMIDREDISFFGRMV